MRGHLFRVGLQSSRRDLEHRSDPKSQWPLAVSPADPNLVIFGSPGDSRRSTDGLASMKVVMSDPGTVREIVFSPSNPNVVYAETDG